jgi:hypothetical protein
MEQVTIEGILDRPILKLVKEVPNNRMTRGQVRAATNLVIPDGVNTSEGIIEYVLENYDENNAPPRTWTEEYKRIAQDEERERRRFQREEEQRREDANALVVVEAEANERRTYDVVELYRGRFYARVRFSPSDFDGLQTKDAVIAMMEDKAQSRMWEEGINDEDHIDTIDSEFRDSDDFEHETDYEQIWESNKQAISAYLGTTPEEME